MTEQQRAHAEVIVRRLAVVQECDYRGARDGCGCDDGRRCGLGRGRAGRVTLNDCFVCVREGTWEGAR